MCADGVSVYDSGSAFLCVFEPPYSFVNMTPEEVQEFRCDFDYYLSKGCIGEALLLLEDMAKKTGRYDLLDATRRLIESYRLMLNHLISGGADPQRGMLLERITARSAILSDMLEMESLEEHENTLFFKRRKELSTLTFESLVHR